MSGSRRAEVDASHRRAAAGVALSDATPAGHWVVRVERTVVANDGRRGRLAGWWAGPARVCEFEVARTLETAAVWPTRRLAEVALRSVFADADGLSAVTRAARRGYRPMRVDSARQLVGSMVTAPESPTSIGQFRHSA